MKYLINFEVESDLPPDDLIHKVDEAITVQVNGGWIIITQIQATPLTEKQATPSVENIAHGYAFRDPTTKSMQNKEGLWRVSWKGEILGPTFQSKGAAEAFISGLRKGRKTS